MASIRDVQKMCVDGGGGGPNHSNNCLPPGDASVAKFTRTTGQGAPSGPKAWKNSRVNQLGRH